MMLKNKEATPTSVWIDVNNCPIPDGYDVGQIRPRIESALVEKIGCSCPLTINVMGELEGITDEDLRELSSTGVVVQFVPRGTGTGSGKVLSHMLNWSLANPPPGKIMFISDSRNIYNVSGGFSYLHNRGFDIFLVYGDTVKPVPGLSTAAIWEWQSLLCAPFSPSARLEEVMDGETKRQQPDEEMDGEIKRQQPPLQCETGDSASFVCTLCFNYTCMKYFKCQLLEDFTTHFNSEEHKRRYFNLTYFPPGPGGDSSKRKSKPKVVKAGLKCFHLMNSVVMKSSQSKRKLDMKKKKKKMKK